MLVGLWPANDAVFKDEEVRGFVGADHYSRSLRESVELCLEEAVGAPEAEGKAPARAAAAR
jgi:hypothetical protein